VSDKTLTPSDLANLHARGLTDETIENAKLYSVDAREGSELIGRPLTALHDHSGIAIANYWPDEDGPRQIRLRLSNPSIEEKPDGSRKEKQKYLTAPGMPNRFYIPPGTPVEWLTDTSIPVVFLEGEFKGLRTYQAMRVAGRECLVIGLLGVWGWKGKTGKEAAQNGGSRNVYGIISDFDRVVWQGRRVTVCYDADVETNWRVKRARSGLIETLMTLGAEVLIADVPKEEHAIDDVMAEHGDEAGLALLDSARGAKGNKFKLIHASELDSLPRSTFIQGTKIIERGYTLVYGQSETGKSFWCMDAAYHVSHIGPVVYVAAEGAGGLAQRRDAWQQHYKLSLGAIYFVPLAVNLLDNIEVWEFIDVIKAKFPQSILFVVFDTKSRCMVGGEENSAKDDGIQVDNCNQIQRALGCAVVVIHHSGATDLRERGSTVSRNAADSVISFQRNDDLITVSCSKLKDGEHWPDEKFQFVTSGESVVLLPANEVANEYAKQTPQQIKVLEALSLAIFADRPATAGELQEQTGIKERSLYRILSTLKDRGLLCQNRVGRGYSITLAGRAALPATVNVADLARSNGHSELEPALPVCQGSAKALPIEDDTLPPTVTHSKCDSVADRQVDDIEWPLEREGDYTLDPQEEWAEQW
jgi:DNA-binding transcriptional ArsR family regulator